MKVTRVLTAAIALCVSHTALADKLLIKNCFCFSDTKVGYISRYTVTGRSTGLPEDLNSWDRHNTAIRDDYTRSASSGLLCLHGDPNNRTDYVSIPAFRYQYFSEEEMVPPKDSQNCAKVGGLDVCASPSALKIGKKRKVLPWVYKYPLTKSWLIGNDECAGVCKELWPEDAFARPACEVTNLDMNDRDKYGKNFQTGCKQYATPEWDWKTVGRPYRWR
jgi:hypothetical protein